MNYAAFRVAAISGVLGASLASGFAAHAAGVPAGTLIENTASASYRTGGPAQTVESNTVGFRVAELLDVAVAAQDAAAVPLGASVSALAFTVTNTGNGPEAFVLSAEVVVAGNDFDAVPRGLATDSNGNGVYDPGVDAPLADGGTTDALAPDQGLTVFVLVTAPQGVADGQSSQLRLLARAATGTGNPGTVFAGAGEGGVDAVAGSSGADDDAAASLTSSAATVALVKSATIADPFGGAQPVSGAIVTYTLTATVSGSGSVDDLLITDTIPAATSYAPGTLTLDSAGLTDAADADAGKASPAGVSVNLGTVAGGTTRTVTFQVEID